MTSTVPWKYRSMDLAMESKVKDAPYSPTERLLRRGVSTEVKVTLPFASFSSEPQDETAWKPQLWVAETASSLNAEPLAFRKEKEALSL